MPWIFFTIFLEDLNPNKIYLIHCVKCTKEVIQVLLKLHVGVKIGSRKRDQHRSLTHDFQEDGQVDDSLCGRPMSGGGGVDKEACAAMVDAT